MDLLRALNKVDMELYNFARNLPAKSAAPASSVRSDAERPPPSPPGAVNPFARTERGTLEMIVREVKVRGAHCSSPALLQGEPVELEIQGESTIASPPCVVGFGIKSRLGFEMYGTNTLLLGQTLAFRPGERFTILFSFAMDLAPGDYQLSVSLHPAGPDEGRAYNGSTTTASSNVVLHWCGRAPHSSIYTRKSS